MTYHQLFLTFIASKSLKLSCALNCVLMYANNIKRISNWLILVFEVRKKFEAISHQKKLFPNPSDTQWRYDKYLTNLVLSVRTVTYQSAFSPLIYGLCTSSLCHKLMGQNLVHNLQYGPPTQLIRVFQWLPGFGFGTSLGNGVLGFSACRIGGFNPSPPPGFLGGGRAGATNKDSKSDVLKSWHFWAWFG